MNIAGGRPDGRRGKAAAGLLLAAALTAGCTAADPAGPAAPKPLQATATAAGGGAPSTPVPPPATRPLDAAELLTAALPDGEIGPAGSSEKKVYARDLAWAPKSISVPDCVLIVDPYRDRSQPTTVVQTFRSEENLEWTGATTLTAHPGPAAAAAEFNRLRKGLQGCREFRTPGAGVGTRTTLAEGRAPAQGDEAVAYTLTSWTDVSDINPDAKEIRTIRRSTVVRIGSVIAEFELEPSPSVETMEFPTELMTRQVQRLRNLR
ncbi:hypothetical protein [Streptomyces sp. NBC_01294]|uniref:hypothetical protein n=1 Tax=Streptomyces sp. NBC_01294 TaxID=2903815 RepID=UPI002DD7AD69|nr:hypothetical protein [Streptomyces sp. NBC_01294]WRZ55326.1 hypothetical protein OG534_01800 [Streptomyces sp. NBC_01294]WRZ61370.1 hypothetical protein OG534_35700 [Streptomyces sp. NBC_01294]